MGKIYNPTIKDVIKKARRNNRTVNTNMILKAYAYADDKHKNQYRKSGEPYIIHPLYVAYILADLGLDTDTICAALLHDVVEDTDSTYEDIEKEFSKGIAEIVEGVTKLGKLFDTVEEKQAENYKKMFVAMEKDIRVILLKIADRLHNAMTLEHLKRDRQIYIAEETLEVYAQIANKLGLYDIKCRLEEECFKILYPDEYKNLLEQVEKKKEEKLENLQKTKKRLEIELKRQRIPTIISIETKHLYNLYKKMQSKNLTLDEIKDLFAIKILVKNKQTCYIVMGIINKLYKLLPGTFKDYIAVPRMNMYQAIHGTLLGEKGVIFEAQICSYDMNKISKYGITAYFSYMKNTNKQEGNESVFKEKLSGIQNSLELEKQINDPKQFLNTLKTELFEDEVYVFTPKGEIRVLPKGATAIDFAYSISEEIGNHLIGCKINSVNMPVITTLKSGNIVEIITSQRELMPNENWLEYIKTAKAKNELIKHLDKMEQQKKNRIVTLEIEIEDRNGLALDITKCIQETNTNVLALKSEMKENKQGFLIIVMEIETKEKLEKIKKSILEVKNVKSIRELENKEFEKF